MLTGLLFGQDVLILKSGEVYNGTFIEKVGLSSIVFQVEGENDSTKFPMKDVAMIKTSDGELTYPFKIPTKEKDSSILWAQTDFDTLIMKNGTTYFGEYFKIEGEIVYFKPQNANSFQPISIKQIQTLKLKNGHFIIGGELNTKRIVLTCCVITVVIFFLLLFGFDGIDMSGYDLSGHGTAW